MARPLNDIKSTEQEFGTNQNEWIFGENGEYQGTSMEHEEALRAMNTPDIEDGHESPSEFREGLKEWRQAAYDASDKLYHSGATEVMKNDESSYMKVAGHSAEFVSQNKESIEAAAVALEDKAVDTGKAFGEEMNRMSGGITQGEMINAKIMHDSQQYTELPEKQTETKSPSTSREQINSFTNTSKEFTTPDTSFNDKQEQLSFNFDR